MSPSKVRLLRILKFARYAFILLAKSVRRTQNPVLEDIGFSHCATPRPSWFFTISGQAGAAPAPNGGNVIWLLAIIFGSDRRAGARSRREDGGPEPHHNRSHGIEVLRHNAVSAASWLASVSANFWETWRGFSFSGGAFVIVLSWPGFKGSAAQLIRFQAHFVDRVGFSAKSKGKLVIAGKCAKLDTVAYSYGYFNYCWLLIRL